MQTQYLVFVTISHECRTLPPPAGPALKEHRAYTAQPACTPTPSPQDLNAHHPPKPPLLQPTGRGRGAQREAQHKDESSVRGRGHLADGDGVGLLHPAGLGQDHTGWSLHLADLAGSGRPGLAYRRTCALHWGWAGQL